MVLGGAVLVVRGWRMGVSCEQGDIVVRGLLWTRRIPRSTVIELTDFPAIRWRSGRRQRWTPIVAFMRGTGALPFVERHDEAQIARLERWLRRR